MNRLNRFAGCGGLRKPTDHSWILADLKGTEYEVMHAATCRVLKSTPSLAVGIFCVEHSSGWFSKITPCTLRTSTVICGCSRLRLETGPVDQVLDTSQGGRWPAIWIFTKRSEQKSYVYDNQLLYGFRRLDAYNCTCPPAKVTGGFTGTAVANSALTVKDAVHYWIWKHIDSGM
jgi:hypothetical protein